MNFKKGDKFSILCHSSHTTPTPIIEWTIIKESDECVWMDYYYPNEKASGKNRRYTKKQILNYMPKTWELISYTPAFEPLPEELFNV